MTVPPQPGRLRRRACRSSPGTQARRALDGCPTGGASTSPTRRSTGTPPGRGATASALRWLRRDGTVDRRHLRASSAAATNRFANVLAHASASARATGCSRCSGGSRSSTLPCSARSRTRSVVCPRCSPPSGPSRSASGMRPAATAAVLVTTPALYRRKVAAHPRRSCPSLEHVLLVGPAATPSGRGTLDFDDAAAPPPSDGFDDRPDRSRGHGAAALHQRHHRDAEGRGPRARRRRRPPRHRLLRARPAPRRRLLVHRRSRLGDRHVLRDHRPAHPRRDQHRRRGRVRRRALVPHPRRTSGSPSGTPRPRRCAC